MSRKIAPILLVGGCLAAALAVYWPTLGSGFVYDSRLQIQTDDFIHCPANIARVLTLRVLAMDVLDFNRPVQLFSLMLDALIWGKRAFGYHLTNILIHGLNTAMVFVIVRKIAGGSSWAALAGAAVFLGHPALTEAVCEPSYREDLLVAMFLLGGLLAFAGICGKTGGARQRVRVAAVLGCGFLAVASKETGIVSPLLLVVWWSVLGGAGKAGSGAGGGGMWSRIGASDFRGRMAAIVGAALAIGLFLVANRVLAPEHSEIFRAKPGYLGGSFGEMLKIAPRIFAGYTQIVLWPTNLCADHGLYGVRHYPLGLAVWMLGAVACGMFVWGWNDRRAWIGVALILLPLLPVSNVVPLFRPMADRYLYLPMAGIAVLCGLAVGGLRRRLGVAGGVVGVAGAIAVLWLMAGIHRERQRVWSNSLELWADTIRKAPFSTNAMVGLGWESIWSGRYEDAVRYFGGAIKNEGSRAPSAQAAMALSYWLAGDMESARKNYEVALGKEPLLADPDGLVRRLMWEKEEAQLLARFRATL